MPQLDDDMRAASASAIGAWRRGVALIQQFHNHGAAGDMEKAETARLCAMAELEASLDHMMVAYRKLSMARG